MTDINGDEGEPQLLLADASVAAEVSERIAVAEKKLGWVSGHRIDLGGVHWVPAAVSEDFKTLLHVTLGGSLAKYARRRLVQARAQGVRIRIALTTESLFSEELILILAELDADVYVIDDRVRKWQTKPRHVMAALADLQVPVSASVRKQVGHHAWASLSVGTKQERGRRLEAFLAFLLSQLSDLRVVERNYRTASQEIDLVLQIDSLSNRVWQKSGSPLMLVEAKNTAARATQQMVSVLIQKLQTKRTSTRIGLLVSPNGFTADAKLEELRSSRSEVCVVMIDRDDLLALIAADDLDECLEGLVRHALLR